ncbi:MAG: response regulator [Gemmataceae bacterium]|nr:response regulator [Gemmataceae bacterium]
MSGQNANLLLIEDNEITREGLATVLRNAGYAVSPCTNGRQGLDYLRAGHKTELILLDMLMPDLDGWQFLDELGRWPRALDVPIVVVTGTILTREWAHSHGCRGFLRKPVDCAELLEQVRRCLGESL